MQQLHCGWKPNGKNVMVETYYIHIVDLAVQARIGCTAEERSKLQMIKFDLHLETTGFEHVSTSKDIADTICYFTVAKEVEAIVSSRDWILLEELAGVINSALFEKHAQLLRARILIKKHVIDNCQWTGVEIVSHGPRAQV